MSNWQIPQTSSGASLIVSLPWYDVPGTRASTDSLWGLLSAHLSATINSALPKHLDRDTPIATQWVSDRLLLTQVCGYNAAITHASRFAVVAAPVLRFDTLGDAQPPLPAGYYLSHIVVRDTDPAGSLSELAGRSCVINGFDSQSGYHAFATLLRERGVARAGLFGRTLVSGSHVRSLHMLRTHQADVASIDAATWQLLKRHAPAHVDGLRVLAHTGSAPAPPYVTAQATSQPVYQALVDAFERVATADGFAPVGDALGITGFLTGIAGRYSRDSFPTATPDSGIVP